jgi:hypothetical protein
MRSLGKKTIVGREELIIYRRPNGVYINDGTAELANLDATLCSQYYATGRETSMVQSLYHVASGGAEGYRHVFKANAS